MKPRKAKIRRKTSETNIELELVLDGSGKSAIQSGIGFLDHMLVLLSQHSGADLTLNAAGDLDVDEHHLVEDVGIVLGQALAEALGGKEGIERYGASLIPMDEVLAAVAIDLSGRFAFVTDYRPQRESVGDLPTELVVHFFRSLALEARMTLHIKMLEPGENEHHRIEAIFKAFARALRASVRIDPQLGDAVPSSKGRL
ncbi:MAG: imidazoleglycerol-phosphate dehydratase HisB [Acidobacteriota bacterium]|jgi:imidazoleglycerol phosphate dehydratase HisB